MKEGSAGEQPTVEEAAGVLVQEEDGDLRDKILRQVDYYFSVENLCRDKWLLGRMKGRKNRPIPLAVICGFAKLRDLGDMTAVENALRSSTAVDLVQVDGKPHVQRKTAFIKDDHLDKFATQPMTQASHPASQPVLPIRSKTKPSGFEEYYADPPITPMEYEDELELYDPSLPFAERIETALQRFEAKRKWDSYVKNVFTKFVMFGGINCGPKQFASTANKEFLESHNAKEIAQASSTMYISDDKWLEGAEAKWQVSFERVLQSFLSTVMQDLFQLDSLSKIMQCTNLFRNFYNYLLHHNVCPEYADDIYAARRLCTVGANELHATIKLLSVLPGPFNEACSVIFGGSLRTMDDSADPWSHSSEAKTSMSGQDRFALSFAKGIARINKLDGITLSQDRVAYTYRRELSHTGLQVVEIQPVSDLDRPKASSDADADADTNANAMGKLKCRTWRMPTFEADDLPDGMSSNPPAASYTFYLENSVLEWFAPGMKLDANVNSISDQRGNTLHFIDRVGNVFCSFYLPLENELLRGYKEPKPISRETLLAQARAKEQVDTEDALNRSEDDDDDANRVDD